MRNLGQESRLGSHQCLLVNSVSQHDNRPEMQARPRSEQWRTPAPPRQLEWRPFQSQLPSQAMLKTSVHLLVASPGIILLPAAPGRMSGDHFHKAQAPSLTPLSPPLRLRLIICFIYSLLFTRRKTPRTKKAFLREGPFLISRHPIRLVGRTAQGHP